MKNWRSVPIPERMRDLPRDRRGFPIFVIALRDKAGDPVFTVNDQRVQHRCVLEDRCMICGTKLFRGRWLVGGPMSAFDPAGTYADGPMHHDCMTYAMKVCPYLATPNYTKDLAALSIPKMAGEGVTTVEAGTLAGQPTVFVAVMTTQTIDVNYNAAYVPYFKPRRPYTRIEYWRGGGLLTEPIAKPMIAEYMEMRSTQEATPTVVHFPSELTSR